MPALRNHSMALDFQPTTSPPHEVFREQQDNGNLNKIDLSALSYGVPSGNVINSQASKQVGGGVLLSIGLFDTLFPNY